MNDQHPSAEAPPGRDDGVIVAGAGPVGCTAALLLADLGVPVTLLERHTKPHPLPRAVHLDDEVARTLYRIGVSDDFLARSRSCSGLRLLNATHQVMAEFRREHQAGVHGFPQANMFHQPDLEQLLLARVEQHPLIEFRRGAEICGLDDPPGAVTAAPVRVRACLDGEQTEQTFTGRYVLGCDGANSTVRELAGITMDDHGFTERWLVVDIRADAPLDTWDGVEQVCDPAQAATFMQVTGDRYRWEFQLHDGEDEASMTTPTPSAGSWNPGPGAGTWTAWRSPVPPPTRSGPGWHRASRPGGCSSSATPHTSPHRSSARAWRPGCATPTTSPGRSRTCCPGRPGRICSPATRPNAAPTPAP